MELFHGDTRHWLEQGNGVDLWRCVALVGTGWWDWFMGLSVGTHDTGWIRVMGLIYGGVPWGMQHGLDRGDGIDLWDTSWGHTTGSERWDWFEGARHWDVTLAVTRHGGATGSERWDWFVGARHGGAILAGCELWDWFIGVFHGGRNWIRAMELICGGEPWGAWHWLDLGEGIDLCGRVMRARDTGWIGAMGLIHGGVSNGKVLYGCWV